MPKITVRRSEHIKKEEESSSSESESERDSKPAKKRNRRTVKERNQAKEVSKTSLVWPKYDALKKDAVAARDTVASFTKGDTYNKNGQPTVRQLPVDENGLLQEFDPTTMVGDDYTVSIFGKRRTGKTWVARNLIYIKRNRFNHGLVITKTKFNGFWQNYFPEAVVHGSYDPMILQQFMLVQLEIMAWNEKHPNEKINRRAVVILDDIVCDKHVRYDDTLATLFYNGRHFGIFLIVCSQYVFGLPPGLRSNSDLVFIMRQFQKRQRDQLNEDFADMLEDDTELFEAMDKNTQDNGCMVVDISDPNKQIAEMFYRWKAELTPLFEVGSLIWKNTIWVEGEKKRKEAYSNEYRDMKPEK